MSTPALDHVVSNESIRHDWFPITRSRIFLAHAGVSTLPRVTAEALQKEAQRSSVDDPEGADYMGRVEAIRTVGASLIGAHKSEISLLGPTSLGLNLVAQGLDWKAGDEVIYYAEDYPANVYPWMYLAQTRGVRPVALQPKRTGEITPELVFAAITSRTKLVALASCHFLTGYRLDYRAIGEELRRRGILFSMDGIQSLGVTAVDAQYVDFISADSHKWMIGPSGAGIFYVKKESIEKLTPSLVGSWNVRSPNFVAQPEIKFENTARRYEPGSLYLLGLEGMKRSIELLLSFGIEAIEQRAHQLRSVIVEEAHKKGLKVLFDDVPVERMGGISTIALPGRDILALTAKFSQAKVSVSLRHDRNQIPHLRLSPHFYNTEAEIKAALALL
jgi:cysteine desulfurase / selenocysteine lyase